MNCDESGTWQRDADGSAATQIRKSQKVNKVQIIQTYTHFDLRCAHFAQWEISSAWQRTHALAPSFVRMERRVGDVAVLTHLRKRHIDQYGSVKCKKLRKVSESERGWSTNENHSDRHDGKSIFERMCSDYLALRPHISYLPYSYYY